PKLPIRPHGQRDARTEAGRRRSCRPGISASRAVPAGGPPDQEHHGRTPSMSASTLPMRLFAFGLGYSALASIERLRPGLAHAAGTVREESRTAALGGRGIAACRFDGEAHDPKLIGALDRATHLLASVPPGAAGDPVLASFGAMLAEAP